MGNLKSYVSGRWGASSVPTVRNAAAALRTSVTEIAEQAAAEGMILAGNLGGATGSLGIFPSVEMYQGMDSQVQDTVANAIDSGVFYREDGVPLLPEDYSAEAPAVCPEPPEWCEESLAVEPEPQPEQPVSMAEVEEVMPEVEEVLRRLGEEADSESRVPYTVAQGILAQAEEYYARTIPVRDGWTLDPKRPYQLPLEAYSDWRMAHGDLGLGSDVAVPLSDLFRVARNRRCAGRVHFLTGNENGTQEPFDPRFQTFRAKGRKYVTSSTLEHVKEASKKAYKRKSWIR